MYLIGFIKFFMLISLNAWILFNYLTKGLLFNLELSNRLSNRLGSKGFTLKTDDIYYYYYYYYYLLPLFRFLKITQVGCTLWCLRYFFFFTHRNSIFFMEFFFFNWKYTITHDQCYIHKVATCHDFSLIFSKIIFYSNMV